MTTTIVVKANHGWPVDVTPYTKNAEDPSVADGGTKTRVEPNTERTFTIWDGHDIYIHEVQPAELAAEKADEAAENTEAPAPSEE